MLLSNTSTVALFLAVIVTCVTARSLVRRTVEESASNTTVSEDSRTRPSNVMITENYQKYILYKKIFLWREWDVEGVFGGMVAGFGLSVIGIVLYRSFAVRRPQ